MVNQVRVNQRTVHKLFCHDMKFWKDDMSMVTKID